MDNALAIAGAAGGNWYLIIFGLLLSVPIILFGSTIVVKIIERYPNSIYVGSFVLFVVAFKMIVSEPFIDQHIDPLHDWAEKGVPWILAIILLFKQYYRNEIRVKNETSNMLRSSS